MVEDKPIEKQQEINESNPDVIKIAGPVPISAWFIIVNECSERFAFYGATLLFIPYLLLQLGLSKAEATAINRAFQFLAYFTTIIGAIISDSYLGKFKTILGFSFLYCIGLLLLSMSSAPFSTETGFGLTGFCLSIFLFIAWGTGGIKANVSAFAAEQVDKQRIEESTLITTDSSGKKYQIDYDMTVERIFRFFYWAINVGSLFGQLICPVVANNLGSYPIAYGIPSIVFALGILVFIAGKNLYIVKPIEGNPLFKTIRLITFALKEKSVHKNEAKHFLDYGKKEYDLEWDHQFVDDLKLTLKSCKVFFFYIFYWALYYNMSDAFITQGMNMQKPKWLGAEQLNLVNSLVLVITLPIFDYVIFPLLRRAGFRMGLICRISIGFFLATLGFVFVTILQKVLYSTGPFYDFTNLPDDVKFPQNDLSIWYQIIPYGVIAMSEIFASATGLEYAYKNAAPQLKSVVMALFLLTNCGGSLIGLVLAIWSRDPNYVTLFAVQTTVMGVLTVVFYWLFRKLDYQN